MGPYAILYPVAPGTAFHVTTAVLMDTVLTLRLSTELEATRKIYKLAKFFKKNQAIMLNSCLLS